MKTEDLKNFLNSFADSIEKENTELYKNIIESSNITKCENPSEFFHAVIHPFDKFISGFLKTTLSANRDVEFIWKNSQFIERHFRNLFEKYEGGAYSSDKSKTILSGLLRYFSSGEMIEFNYDAKYTYHLPKIIFKSHDQIIEFYEGIKDVFYGHPEKYLKALKNVLQTQV